MAALHVPSSPLHIAYLSSAPLVAQRDARRHHGDSQEALGQLDLTREKRMLVDALHESRRDVSIRFDNATSDNLSKVLTLGCRALHYSGHGVEGELVFEDGYGKAHFLKSAALGALLRAGSSSTQTMALQFVFVSACHSQAAGEAFAAAGVPHVVAVHRRKAISDAASCLFAHHFYLALLAGKTVRDCFDISRAAIAASPEPGINQCQDLFTLLPPKANHHVSIFSDLSRLPAGTTVNDMSPLPSLNTFENPPSFFVGRALECQQIYEHLRRGARCVTVNGRPGIGKTAVVAKVCEYATIRRAFSKIYLVDLSRGCANGDRAGFSTVGQMGSNGAAMLAAGDKIAGRAFDYDSLFCQAMATDVSRSSLERGDEIDHRCRTLFAIEGLGEALRKDGHALRSFLGRLISRHGGVQILASTSGDCIGGAHLTGASEKIVTVKGLTDKSAALLLTASAPRKLSLAEVGASSVEDALTALSRCQDVSLDMFLKFFTFWEEVIGTAARLGGELSQVYGFLGREGTSQILEDTTPGTFLVRFSDSKPGFLAIAWKDGGTPGTIRQSLIERQRSGWVVRLSDGHVHVYSTLSQMVMKVNIFKALYTKSGVKDKANAFADGAARTKT
eukprot:g5406.t1